MYVIYIYVYIYIYIHIYHSVLQGISPTLKYWPHLFYLSLPKYYEPVRPPSLPPLSPLWATPIKIDSSSVLLNIQLQNLKIKGEMTSSTYVFSTWWLVTDLIGIFNSDSRKTASKFSDLRWFFFFFEDLYNREGSLQAKQVAKNIRN